MLAAGYLPAGCLPAVCCLAGVYCNFSPFNCLSHLSFAFVNSILLCGILSSLLVNSLNLASGIYNLSSAPLALWLWPLWPGCYSWRRREVVSSHFLKACLKCPTPLLPHASLPCMGVVGPVGYSTTIKHITASTHMIALMSLLLAAWPVFSPNSL